MSFWALILRNKPYLSEIVLFINLWKYTCHYLGRIWKTVIKQHLWIVSRALSRFHWKTTDFGLQIGIFPKCRIVIPSKYAGFQFVPAHLFPSVVQLKTNVLTKCFDFQTNVFRKNRKSIPPDHEFSGTAVWNNPKRFFLKNPLAPLVPLDA